MIEFIRGTVVEFEDIQFRDSDGEATVPTSATLRVRYLECGEEKFDESDLTVSGGLWSGSWDSSDADAGTIYWFIQTTPTGKPVEGQFRLKANPANGAFDS